MYRPYPHAQVVADTICHGHRLTTMEVTFHRWVLAEVNTHRAFSRNSASSRAIPLEIQLGRAKDHTAYPIEWSSEKPGMSGGASLEGQDLRDAQDLWDRLAEGVTSTIDEYVEAHPERGSRLHKSLLNRWLEVMMYHTAIITSTEWDNFFKQRLELNDDGTPKAQMEFYVPARMMKDALDLSTPTEIEWGGFHLPYIGLNPEDAGLTTFEAMKVSSARCARVSHLNHDGLRDINDDFRLFEETLAKYGHWSPLEHVATPRLGYAASMFPGNFGPPWVQFRHLVELWGGGGLDLAESATQHILHPATISMGMSL